MSTPPSAADAANVPEVCAEGTSRGPITDPMTARVDDAHRDVPGRAAAKRTGRPGAATPPDPASPPVPSQRADDVPAEGEDWLRLHATDLIDRLQQTAETLDAREARLHAQIAMHERREREFRLWSDSQREELAELHRDATRLRDQLQAEARRLVMSDPRD